MTISARLGLKIEPRAEDLLKRIDIFYSLVFSLEHLLCGKYQEQRKLVKVKTDVVTKDVEKTDAMYDYQEGQLSPNHEYTHSGY